MTTAPIPCSRMPKCRLRPPYSPAATLSAPSMIVFVEPARSAEPPTRSGRPAAAHWIASSDALRVASDSSSSGVLSFIPESQPSGSSLERMRSSSESASSSLNFSFHSWRGFARSATSSL